MKIAIISNMLGQPWTGSEELWADTVEAALEAGDEVLVSLWRWDTVPPRVAELQKRGVKITFRPRPRRFPSGDDILQKLIGKRVKLPRPFPRPLRFSPYREVFEFRPDVILLSQGWTYEFRDNWNLVAQLNACKIPLVVLNQSGGEDPVSPQMRADLLAFAPRAAKIAFVSQGNFTAVQRQIAAPLPNGLVVRNPVNLRDFSAVPWPENPDESAGETWNFAAVGRLETPHKGQDVLLEALSAPAWRERPWKLRFYGSGFDKDYIAALIKHFGLSEKVEFGGHVPDVRAIWERHHLLLMPSRVEGTPLALIEAMWCARAALVTDVAGHLEWISEGRTGFVASAPSARSLGRALERAWAARSSWREMGLAARDAAAARYDPAPGKTLLEVLRDAAQKRN